MLPERFRVTGTARETSDTWTLALEPLDRPEPLAFAPGQFNMVYAFGAGEVPISISGDPDQSRPARSTRCGPWAPRPRPICAASAGHRAGHPGAVRERLAGRDARREPTS